MNDDNEVVLKFGAKLREIRVNKGLNQLDLALKLKVNSNDISGYETGKRNVTIKTADKIAKALEVSLKDLFDF